MHDPSAPAPPLPSNPYSAPRASILPVAPGPVGTLPLSVLASPQRRLTGALAYYGASLLAALPLAPLLLIDQYDSDPYYLVLGLGFILSGLLSLSLLCANIWLATTRGQTVGKWLVGTQVVTANGQPASRPRILGRYMVKSVLVAIMSCLAFSEDLLILAPDRRALHDHIAGTWVVDLEPMERLRANRAASLPEADEPAKPTHAAWLDDVTASPGRRFASGMVGWGVLFSMMGLTLLPSPLAPDLDPDLALEIGGALAIGAAMVWTLINLLVVHTRGTTISRLLLDLVVVDEHGAPVTWQIYLFRAAMEYGTFTILLAFCISPVVFLGYLPIFLSGRSLTDLATRTWVLRRGDAEPEPAR